VRHRSSVPPATGPETASPRTPRRPSPRPGRPGSRTCPR
jgi:hypothetical protein